MTPARRTGRVSRRDKIPYAALCIVYGLSEHFRQPVLRPHFWIT